MGKIKELRIARMNTEEGEVISWKLKLVAVDEEGGKFREEKAFVIDLDDDTDEKVQEIVREAEAWISQSRKRYMRALEIANKLGIPLKLEEH
ncbi:MAG: hypothetical protein QW726_05455 [Fervidicoccaceae archaeon]